MGDILLPYSMRGNVMFYLREGGTIWSSLPRFTILFYFITWEGPMVTEHLFPNILLREGSSHHWPRRRRHPTTIIGFRFLLASAQYRLSWGFNPWIFWRLRPVTIWRRSPPVWLLLARVGGRFRRSESDPWQKKNLLLMCWVFFELDAHPFVANIIVDILSW